MHHQTSRWASGSPASEAASLLLLAACCAVFGFYAFVFAAVVFDVAVADSASAAMDVIAENELEPFGLVLLDMRLPDRDAFDLLPDMRASVGEDVAIVVYSVACFWTWNKKRILAVTTA